MNFLFPNTSFLSYEMIQFFSLFLLFFSFTHLSLFLSLPFVLVFSLNFHKLFFFYLILIHSLVVLLLLTQFIFFDFILSFFPLTSAFLKLNFILLFYELLHLSFLTIKVEDFLVYLWSYSLWLILLRSHVD